MPEKFEITDNMKKIAEEDAAVGQEMAERIIKDRGEEPEDKIIKTMEEDMAELNKIADKKLPKPDYEGRPEAEKIETVEGKTLTLEQELDNAKENYKQRLHVALTLANTVAEAAGGWEQRVDTIKEMEEDAKNAKPETAIVIYKSLKDELESFIADYEMK